LNVKYEFATEDGKKLNVTLPFILEIDSHWERIRALTFWTKEPETIYWIGSFQDTQDLVFWDVGANIGVYSLFCACANPCSRIFAFEPQNTNFLRLLTNIHINGFANMISPQFMALSDKNGFAEFYVANPEAGASGGQLHPVGDGAKYEIPMMTGDTFAEMMGVYPTHLKIDVDGHELGILKGMQNVLSCVQSLLVEANDPAVVEHLKGFGLEPDERYNSLRGSGWKRSSNTNIIFTRI